MYPIAKISQNSKDFIILQINTRSLIKNFDKIEELLITSKITPNILYKLEIRAEEDRFFELVSGVYVDDRQDATLVLTIGKKW